MIDKQLPAQISDVEKLNSLLDISAILNTQLDLHQLLSLIMLFSQDLLSAEASSLFLLDESRNHLYCEIALGEKGETIQQYLRLPLGQGIAGWVAAQGKPLVIEDPYQDDRFNPEWDKKTGFRTRSLICVPLYLKNELLGTLEVMNPVRSEAFTNEDLKLLNALANSAAIAIHNAHMHDSLKKKVLELSLLYEFEKRSSEIKDPKRLGNWLLKRSLELLEARIGTIYLAHHDTRQLSILSARGLSEEDARKIRVEFGQGIAGWVALHTQAVLIKDLESDERYNDKAKHTYSSHSLIAAPLIHQNELLGVISINDKESGYAFNQSDLETLKAIASRLAISLKNHDLFQQISEISEEKRRAARVMQTILPLVPPVRPSIQFGVSYIPYENIGGDFYEFFDLGEYLTGVLIADVTGHGFSAALLAMMVHTVIDTTSIDSKLNPARFFESLNNELCKRMDSSFVTAFYAIIDNDNKTITYANAGHIAPFLYRKNEPETLIKLQTKGRLLGFLEEQEYGQVTLDYEAGDTMHMFTDGMIELQKGEHQVQIDEAEVEKLILQTHNHSDDVLRPGWLLKSILEAHPGCSISDDVTVLTTVFDNLQQN